MDRFQPHHVNPSKSSARVVLCYKNAAKGASHIGLGISALNTMRSLTRHGYWAEVWPSSSCADLACQIEAAQSAAVRDRQHPVSHVVIGALWVPTLELQSMVMRFPQVHFTIVSHSNMGFLDADPNGIRLLREATGMTLSHHNFAIAGNCEKFANAWSVMYGRKTEWLPNLYDYTTSNTVGQRTPWYPGSMLRVGVFGATRQLKNQVTAVAAAIELSSRLRADVEINVSSDRNEGGGTTHNSIRQLTAGLKHVSLREIGWHPWPNFRSIAARMHVMINPSYTESFNVVTADGIAEGVASVVSEAIDWAPQDWQANVDDVNDVARVARRLIQDTHAVDEGQRALKAYADRGALRWQQFLGA